MFWTIFFLRFVFLFECFLFTVLLIPLYWGFGFLFELFHLAYISESEPGSLSSSQPYRLFPEQINFPLYLTRYIFIYKSSCYLKGLRDVRLKVDEGHLIRAFRVCVYVCVRIYIHTCIFFLSFSFCSALSTSV